MIAFSYTGFLRPLEGDAFTRSPFVHCHSELVAFVQMTARFRAKVWCVPKPFASRGSWLVRKKRLASAALGSYPLSCNLLYQEARVGSNRVPGPPSG